MNGCSRGGITHVVIHAQHPPHLRVIEPGVPVDQPKGVQVLVAGVAPQPLEGQDFTVGYTHTCHNILFSS